VTRLPSRDWIAGALLVIVGAFFLAERLVPGLERFIPLLVGLALVGLFLVTRSAGALVPGGVLTGVGIGTLIATQPDSPYGGSAFLVSMGAGFILVSALAAMFGIRDARAWPLVPGSVLITIGVIIIASDQGRPVLEFAETWWPLVLVLVGGWVLSARTGTARARPTTTPGTARRRPASEAPPASVEPMRRRVG
jgi:hypothetical protein